MTAGQTALLVIPTDHLPRAAAIHAWIRGALGNLPAPARLHAAVVTSELVTTARRLGRPPYVLQLTVVDYPDRADHGLLVTVDDCTPELPASLDADLILVRALSRRWGVDRRVAAKSVWAELAFDAGRITLTTPDQPARNPRTGRER